MNRPVMRRGNIYAFIRRYNDIPSGTQVVAVKPVPNSDDLWFMRTIPKGDEPDRSFWCNTIDLALADDKHCALQFATG